MKSENPQMAQISQMRTEEFCTRCGRGLASHGEACLTHDVETWASVRERYQVRANCFLDDVWAEVRRAVEKHPDCPSAHHGLSVIHEEFVELQALVYRQREERTAEEMRQEAVQIAAMAARFALEICDPEIAR